MRRLMGSLLLLGVVCGIAPQMARAGFYPLILKIPTSQLYLEIFYPYNPANGHPIGATAHQAREAMSMYPPTAIRHRHPRLLAVLPGSFHHPKTLWPAGLLLVKRLGVVQPPAQTHPNRPAIGQTTDGQLILTTNRRAWQKRSELRIALEAGPFLIVHGRDWPFGDFSNDPDFYRSTKRCLVGLTDDGQLICASLSGTLSEVRHYLRNAVPRLTLLMNLDGGSSARPDQPITNHLVVFTIDETDDPPPPTPIPQPSPESYLLNLLP